MTASPLHPPGFAGVAQWAETHLALRLLTSGSGWTACDHGNFSRILSPDGERAVSVATGDPLTGTEGPQQPATKYRRGPQTERAIETNRTLPLFDALGQPVFAGEDDEPGMPMPGLVTWYLLVHTDRVKRELRYELSRPDGQDAHGRINSWADRIVFRSLEIESHDIPPDEPAGPEFDFPVDRL